MTTKKYDVLPKAIIIDLDSTLYNIDHRLEYILEQRPKNWKKFYELIPGDTINEWCRDLVNGFSERGYHIVALTGRSASSLQSTIEKLRSDNVSVDEVFMRREDDHRSSRLVKYAHMMNIMKKYDVKLAIDDQKDVVDMYKEIMVQVLQVGNGSVIQPDLPPVACCQMTRSWMMGTDKDLPSYPLDYCYCTEFYYMDRLVLEFEYCIHCEDVMLEGDEVVLLHSPKYNEYTSHPACHKGDVVQ